MRKGPATTFLHSFTGGETGLKPLEWNTKPATPEPTYYVAEYVDDPNDPFRPPRLLRTHARLLTAADAESLTNKLNLAAGNRIVNEVEIVKATPTSHYFMFDEENG